MDFNKILYVNALLLIAIICTLITINVPSASYLLIPYIISLLAILIHVVNKTTFFSTTFFFIVFYIMLFYLQPIYCYIFDNNILPYSLDVHRIYASITINGIILFMTGNMLHKNKGSFKLYKRQAVDLNHINYFKLLMLSISFVVIVLIITSKGIQYFIYGSRLGLREEMGYIGLILNYLGYIVSIVIFLVFFTLKKSRTKSSIFVWFIFLIFIEAFYILAFRLRGFIVGHFLSAVMGLYFSDFFIVVEETNKNSDKINKPKLWFKKFKTLIWLAGILILAITFRFLRGFMEPGNSISNFNFDIRHFIKLSLLSGDLGYAHIVMDLIEIVPSVHNYLMGQSYYRLFFTIIPRFIWLNKPPNTQRIVALWLRPEVTGLTLPPGIQGDLYINFGLAGIFGMILFGIFFNKLDSKHNFHNVIMWSASPVWIFHLVRGGFTNPLMIFFVIYIVTYIIAQKCTSTSKMKAGSK